MLSMSTQSPKCGSVSRLRPASCPATARWGAEGCRGDTSKEPLGQCLVKECKGPLQAS